MISDSGQTWNETHISEMLLMAQTKCKTYSTYKVHTHVSCYDGLYS